MSRCERIALNEHLYFYVVVFLEFFAFRYQILQIIFTVLGSSIHQWSGRLGFSPRSHHTKDFRNAT